MDADEMICMSVTDRPWRAAADCVNGLFGRRLDIYVADVCTIYRSNASERLDDWSNARTAAQRSRRRRVFGAIRTRVSATQTRDLSGSRQRLRASLTPVRKVYVCAATEGLGAFDSGGPRFDVGFIFTKQVAKITKQTSKVI